MKSAQGRAARDPVCGMEVSPDSAHRLMHDGRVVLFCSASCKAKFEAAPERYHPNARETDATPRAAAPSAAAGGKWTCPMHPEIARYGPGSCPICGMALEPMLPSADAGPNPELIDMTR